MPELNDKQKRFCNEYLIDFNGKQAAIRSGYTPKTAEVQASRLLSYAKVQEYISAKQKDLADKSDITQQMVLEGYRKLAFYDARKLYDGNGNLLHVPDLDDETAFALNGFEVMEEKGGDGQGHQGVLGYTKKIKMSDRRAALDSICRVLGYNAPAKIAQTDTKGDDVEPPTLIPEHQLDKLTKAINSIGKD